VKAIRPSLNVFRGRREPAVGIEVREKVLARRELRRKESSVVLRLSVRRGCEGMNGRGVFDACGGVNSDLMADEMMP